MSGKKGQLSVELVVVSAVMIALLLAIFLVNGNLQSLWEEQRQSLEAASAAERVSMAINLASSGGNGTRIAFTSLAGPDVENISVYCGRVVRAHYFAGGYSSSPLATNNTNISGAIPLNAKLWIRNDNGLISLEAD